MNKTCLLLMLLLMAPLHCFAETPCKAANLRTEYLENPVGLDFAKPRLYWQLQDGRRSAHQRAYQILAATAADLLQEGKADLWDSGRVESDACVHVAYGGKPLQSRQRCWWTVRVWDKDDKLTEFARPAFFELGLLQPSDWVAKWIGSPEIDKATTETADGIKWIWHETTVTKGTRFFRTEFESPPAKSVQTAVAYLQSDDRHELFVNGDKVTTGAGSRVLTGTSIFGFLRPGRNVLALAVTNEKGDSGVSGVIRVIFQDGTDLRIPTNGDWKSTEQGDNGWNQLEPPTGEWKQASVLAEVGEKPWKSASLQPIGGPASYLRKEFEAKQPVAKATLYVTALGSYRLHINGKRVGDDVLTPDWTDYQKRVAYQTYDVTHLLGRGSNAIGIILGDGWYASALGWQLERNCFGPLPTKLRLQLHVQMKDGSDQVISTDQTWKVSTGPILRSELYAGEIYDARLEQTGWDAPGFADAKWLSAKEYEVPPIVMAAQISPCIQVTGELKPKSVTAPAPGVHVFDMGQNMVGWVRLRVKGPAGTRVQMRFAETLQPDGRIYRDNLRKAEATDVFVLRGTGSEEVFEPHFTYHGFRYVEVSGLPSAPPPGLLTGRVCHTAAPFTGKFHCSDEMVNQLYKNIVWGQKGNLHSVPTDCPQRDERLGWMGDAQIFWRTACYNMNLAPFTRKWMRDVVDAQSPEGGFSNVSPRVVSRNDGAPAWGDAGIIVPWNAYLHYGDKDLLAENWEAMVKWMDYIEKANPDHLWLKRRNNDYGDWVPAESTTDKGVIAQFYWAYDARIMADIAKVLDKPEDVKKYDELHKTLRKAFRKYVKEDGTIGNGSQTCQVLALLGGLVDDDERASVTRHLINDIEKRNGHLSTGFVGTPYLMFALSDTDNDATAYRLLLNRDYPSWGYMIEKGATTMWERWNGDRGDPSMNSFNHYAFGSVGEWMFRNMAGIDTDPAAVGFKQIVFRPRVSDKLSQVSAEQESLFGKIASQWIRDGKGMLKLNVTVPPNCSATVYVPAATPEAVRLDGKKVDESQVTFLRMEKGCAVYAVGAGSYAFSAR